jgi:hypothetical protein
MIISYVAKQLRLPQPMFIAWNTLARRRSSYLMPLVNSCLLDREVMDSRFRPSDPFRNTRNYRAGYTRLFNEYVKHMLSKGVDTLIYPEGGRSYSGTTGEARIKRVFKTAGEAQASLAGEKEIFIVPVSLSFSLVPEADELIRAWHEGSFLPPSSLFHDMQHGDDIYASFRPRYRTVTDFPLIREYREKCHPVYCVIGDPISLRHNDPALGECFDGVKKNLRILPPHFVARLIITGNMDQITEEDLLIPGSELRERLPGDQLNEAYFDEDGLKDILSTGMEFFRHSGAITSGGFVHDPLILEYYSNKCPGEA